MKLLRREIAIKHATRRSLEKKKRPDKKRIAKLMGEIFELQRMLLIKAQSNGMMPAV